MTKKIIFVFSLCMAIQLIASTEEHLSQQELTQREIIEIVHEREDADIKFRIMLASCFSLTALSRFFPPLSQRVHEVIYYALAVPQFFIAYYAVKYALLSRKIKNHKELEQQRLT